MFAVFMIFTALEIEVFTLHRSSAFTGSKITDAACFPANKTLCFPGGRGRSVLRVCQAAGILHCPSVHSCLRRTIAGIWSSFHTDYCTAAA